MIEDYQIVLRLHYVENKKYVTRYETRAGVFTPERWKKSALDAIEAEGEMELLKRVKEHVRKHCAWLHEKNEIEEYAIDCLCSRAYRCWNDFENDDEIIWM